MTFPCPCCHYLTLSEEPSGTFEICPVCFWEDDNIQNDAPAYEGGANGISLNQARDNFRRFGAIKEKYINNVRRPLPEEFT